MITIPDTCYFGPEMKQSSFKSRLTTIRDTVDDNELIGDVLMSEEKQTPQAETKSDSKPIRVPDTVGLSSSDDRPKTTTTTVRDVNETCLGDTNMAEFLLSNRYCPSIESEKQVSTPLAVKRQLQEHGLLDLTNSPTNPNSPVSTPVKPPLKSKSSTVLSNSNSNNKRNEVKSTPIKVRYKRYKVKFINFEQ